MRGAGGIRSVKNNAHMDRAAAEKVWRSLESAIHEIHQQNASVLSFEMLYRNAYNLCLHKHGEILYEGVRKTLDIHLRKVGESVAKAGDEILLRTLSEKWDFHKTTSVMVRDILMYMDRTYVVQSKSDRKRLPVYDLGLQLFRSAVVHHERVKERLSRIVLGLIRRERDGEVIERELIRSALSMLVEVGVHSKSVYISDFEVPFLNETWKYYRSETLEYIENNTCPEYMRKAEDRLEQERRRAQLYLDPSTEAKLMASVEKSWIDEHSSKMVSMANSGFFSMLRDDRIADLKRMYALFSRVPNTLQKMRDALAKEVIETGRALVGEESPHRSPIDFVKALLAMHEKYTKVLTGAFGNDKLFQKTLKTAFEDFVNRGPKCSKFLSTYVDDIMKRSCRDQDEQGMEPQLDKVVTIFRFLNDKDIFESYYKQHLSKRLLSDRSVNDYAEQTMITKLKRECGHQFTQKLEHMFKDIKLSKELMEKYRSNLTRGRIRRQRLPDLNVHVLTTGSWPTPQDDVDASTGIPSAVESCCSGFKGFYLNTHTGRRLTWQMGMGTADIKAKFATGNKELVVSTFQMCILLLFNDSDVLTFKEIKDATGIPANSLKRHIISLSAPKFKVLLKSPKGKSISEENTFEVNEKFKSKLYRVRIPLISMRSKAGGSSKGSRPGAVPLKVEESRRHLIDAAIVRVLKTRKTMLHNNLIAEVTKQLSARFKPTPTQIKKRVESLIERDYMERDEADRKRYLYVA